MSHSPETDPELNLSQLSLSSPLLDTPEAVYEVISSLLEEGDPVAFDAEGVDLCRSGKLSLVQLSNGIHTWLIDITTLGETAFSKGRLKDLLESTTVLKVRTPLEP